MFSSCDPIDGWLANVGASQHIDLKVEQVDTKWYYVASLRKQLNCVFDVIPGSKVETVLLIVEI